MSSVLLSLRLSMFAVAQALTSLVHQKVLSDFVLSQSVNSITLLLIIVILKLLLLSLLLL